jgi:hypothetical protein
LSKLMNSPIFLKKFFLNFQRFESRVTKFPLWTYI